MNKNCKKNLKILNNMTAFFSSRIIFAECLLFFGLIFYGRYDILYYILQKKAGMKPMKKLLPTADWQEA